MLSVQNITAIVVILVFLVELYFCTAGSNHRRKRLLSGWNPVKGRIKTVEEKRDEIKRRRGREREKRKKERRNKEGE